jgi:hypothetical protein
MEDFSSSVINTDNSISSKETAINTSQNLEAKNEISPYMQKQIIKSIAQNLRDIIKENIRKNLMKYVKYDLFYIGRNPPISIEDYINRIYKMTKMNISSLILSVIYIDRFSELNGYILSMKNIHRIILAACLLSIKFNEDVNVNLKYYASIAGIPAYELNNLEFYLIVKLQFGLFVNYDIYQKYFEYFCKRMNNENKKIESSNKIINKKDNI